MTHTRQTLNFLITDIPEPGSRGFVLHSESGQLEGFVVRKDQQVFVYRNRCPHTGVTLDWAESGFLSYDKAVIQCAMHGALFDVEDGRCLWGPCVGAMLEKLRFITDDAGRIMVEP